MNPTSKPSAALSADFDPGRYSVSVQRVLIDDEDLYVGTVAELPDVATYGESFNEAYEAALGVISALRQAALDEHRSFPHPQPPKCEFSGRVTLRMPKHLHARLDAQSQIEGVSLNTWIISLLSNATAYNGLGSQGGAIQTEVFVSNIRVLGTVSVGPANNYLNKIELIQPRLTSTGIYTGQKWQLSSIPATI